MTQNTSLKHKISARTLKLLNPNEHVAANIELSLAVTTSVGPVATKRCWSQRPLISFKVKFTSAPQVHVITKCSNITFRKKTLKVKYCEVTGCIEGRYIGVRQCLGCFYVKRVKKHRQHVQRLFAGFPTVFHEIDNRPAPSQDAPCTRTLTSIISDYGSNIPSIINHFNEERFHLSRESDSIVLGTDRL
ncbi:uncharacterized protein PITG_01965 [Phytophthora infestans T30-4]|uniref:Uncharacterized protein n=1 Tax=Phytophthora infestans (strain T30-4) TaxID=403677 RepID=D0MUJ0_PHYIT|nr:uncharacterized protein PITG_01965 [Phytophthora infestans T30-4]EEY61637.1 conserved hypothetical protein [Phytophthora infestans T30-4]|eukprot:XP_002908554.1 conserved hypothetical protein [Phytophthora infestans T30-4]